MIMEAFFLRYVSFYWSKKKILICSKKFDGL